MKCYLTLAAIIVIVLALTGVWNPFPAAWRWVNTSQELATPKVVWQQRLGGAPRGVTVTGDAVMIEHRTSVEARSTADGRRLWKRKADWAAPAGAGRRSAIVTGKLLVKGYEVLHPGDGRTLRRDTRAVAVWTFRDAVVDAGCVDGDTGCALTAWPTRGGGPLWRVPLPSVDFIMFADNPPLPAAATLTVPRVAPDAGGPAPMPRMLGFPFDDRVQVVDTANGRLVRDTPAGPDERVLLAGGRLIRVAARSRDGGCYFHTRATDPATEQEAWADETLNLRTAPSGCVQREDPAGGGNVLVAVSPDGRELLIDAYDGRAVWTADGRERVAAAGDRHALIRSHDGRRISGVALGRNRAAWSREVAATTQAALVGSMALLVDPDSDTVVALDPGSGTVLLELRSAAKVSAVGPAGLFLTDGREFGYARFATRPDRE
ncbi:hypothetical protein GCM10010201_15600 [Pilimelia columellifera subsp. columellifera]|uniref:Pyrrolo-quinoline quinone repeat domain-containing protein n=1 Tax=Pilimelia columellifera subsp. columellifera TaxID=706583 RepID=A0ABP6ANI1_9ACTN